jgi:hypothetical protein
MVNIKRILIWIASILLGAIANSLVLQGGTKLIPPPAGVKFDTAENLAAAMDKLSPEHFISPFLAHAIGTLVSAFLLTYFLNATKNTAALIAGFIFFCGGAYMVSILPSPLWFDVLDLTLAYFPTALLGYWLGKKIQKPRDF